MSIFKSGIYFGISICDISTGEFYSAEIKDNNNFSAVFTQPRGFLYENLLAVFYLIGKFV